MRPTGYVDPTITADTKRQRIVLDAIRARGLSLHRLHRDGNTLRLTGPGVFVLVGGLSPLSLTDLDAPSDSELRARARLLLETKGV